MDEKRWKITQSYLEIAKEASCPTQPGRSLPGDVLEGLLLPKASQTNPKAAHSTAHHPASVLEERAGLGLK